jgi:hypothetical protein
MKEEKGMNREKKTGQVTRERTWLAEYEKFEADWEFRRARRRALFAKAADAVSGRRTADSVSSTAIHTRHGLAVPLASIIGVMDSRGRQSQGLPLLRHGMIGEWRRLFSLDLDDALLTLTVSPGPGGWYLDGSARAQVILEVLRAKGHGVARITVNPTQEAVRLATEPCGEPTACDSCRECPEELADIAS